MDRTIIAPYKAEEKELSEKLYQKLQGLMLIYPTTVNDELRKVLSWDMFLKPNQNAFFQVMHYLFRLLDAAEFKRRFFWPITDKRSESNFRSSTVEYLKYLNEKHQLKWENIKSYLVVMPGGMKFITFMIDFVGFVVTELIKQREKTLVTDADVQSLKKLDIKRMGRQNQFLKEFASAYLINVEEQIANMNQATQKVKNIINDLSLQCGVSVETFIDDKFLHEFEESNRVLCEENILQPSEKIANLEPLITNLKVTTELFLAKESEDNFNKESVCRALRTVQEVCPNESLTEADCLRPSILGNDDLNVNSLIRAFNSINDTIEDQLYAIDKCNTSNEFISSELQVIKSEIEFIESQITGVQKDLNVKAKQHAAKPKQGQRAPSTPLRQFQKLNCHISDNPLMLKFVSTPPIKLELPSTSRSANVRLPLQDDFNTKPFESLSSMIAPAPPRSARKIKAMDQSADLSSTMNKSKIVDSMQLLRTINKDMSKSKHIPQQNLSTLGSKWKQRQGLFGFDVDAQMPSSPTTMNSISKCSDNSTTTTLMPSQSPYTPFSTNERTRIERRTSINDRNESGGGSTSLLYAKNTAVKKVLDASLNVQNLSTSPSGRLDALVVESSLPKVQLNDDTIEEMALMCEGTAIDKENNLNVSNIEQFQFDISDCADDLSLNNVSDGVLKDISF